MPSTFTLNTQVPFSTTAQISNFNLIQAAIRSLQDGQALGSVTSVGLSLPNIFTVSNSPVTTAGTLTAVFASQTQNLFLASPNGSSGALAVRAIVAADLPLVTGTYGGTGVNNSTKTFTYLKNISFTAADDTGVYTLPTGTKTLVATDVTTLSSLTSAAALATVGTIGTGTWHGTAVAIGYGGTGAASAAAARVNLLPALGSNTLKFLRVNGAETDVEWATVAASITSINSDTAAAQTIVTGNAASAFAISTAAGVTTVQIPNASASLAGFVSTGTQTIAGAKTLSDILTLTAAPVLNALSANSVLFLDGGKSVSQDNSKFNYTSSVLTVANIINTGVLLQSNYITKTANYTLKVTDYMVCFSTTGGTACTATLPDTTTLVGGEEFIVKWLADAGGGVVFTLVVFNAATT